MSLKQELEINSKAIAAYDKGDYDEALINFQVFFTAVDPSRAQVDIC